MNYLVAVGFRSNTDNRAINGTATIRYPLARKEVMSRGKKHKAYFILNPG